MGVRSPLRRLARLSIAILVSSAIALLTGGVAPAGADTTASSSGGMHGIRLSASQVQKLRAIHDQHLHLSVAQALDLATGGGGPAAGVAHPAYAGYAQSSGDCSYMYMYGYDWGYYEWFNKIHQWMPLGEFGEIQFSTDGFTASVSDNWVGGGEYYYLVGTVAWTGWGASGTTMSGWIMLTDGTLCFGTLFARW